MILMKTYGHLIESRLLYARTEVLSAVGKKIMIFWDVRQYGLAHRYQRFRGTLCPHL
jgi:hypothetical protein